MLYSLPLWPDPQKRWSGGWGVGWGVKGVCFWSRKGIVVILNAETLFFFNEQFLEVCDNSQIINNLSFINISSNSWTREARVVILIHDICLLCTNMWFKLTCNYSPFTVFWSNPFFCLFFLCVCVCCFFFSLFLCIYCIHKKIMG